MSIITQSADGVRHEFPDGTNPVVIDKVMKAYATQGAAPQPQPTDMLSQIGSALGGSGTLGGLAQGLIPDTLKGFMIDAPQLAAKVMPVLNPTGAISNALQSVAPNNPVSSAYNSVIDTASKPFQSIDTAYANARAANGNTGFDYARLAGGFLPMLAPGGELAAGRLISKAPELVSATEGVAPQIARNALKYVNDLARSSGGSADTIAQVGAENAGKPLTAAEAIGPRGITHTAALARRGGDAPQVIEGTIVARNMAAPSRMLADFSQAIGVDPAAASGDMAALVDAGRQSAAPLYKAALQGNPVMTPELVALSKRPIIKKAISTAREAMLNEGTDPATVGLQNGTALTDEGWDLVKKALGKQVERHPITQRPLPDNVSANNHSINAASRDLTSALRAAIPGYGEALDASGDYLRLQNAFKRGQDLFAAKKVGEADFAKTFTALSPPEQQAFKGGIANTIFEMAQNGKLNPGAFRTPRTIEKLRAALGDDVTKNLLGQIDSEAKMVAAGRAMLPSSGSQTTPLAVAMAEQDAPTGVDHAINFGIDAALHGPRSATINATSNMRNAILARFRTRGMSPEVRDEAARLLTLSPEELAKLLRQSGIPQGGVPRTLPYGLFGSAAPIAGQTQ